MLRKIGQVSDISLEVASTNLLDEEIQTQFAEASVDYSASFEKTAKELKRVAPKANEFLFFSCVMMHAAEAAAVNADGTPKLTKSGSPVVVGWEKLKNGGVKWITNDPEIQPYRNVNRDIFSEPELIKAHKKWIGKPLCVDHKSSQVESVRGFIVDTFYDHKLRRVVALCALDRKNYPQLARQVETGYSNDVSMGTAVGRACCSECGTVASTEAQYCDHMRNRSCYGEINLDLNPIELSIVVNGADQQAKIKHVIASAQEGLMAYLSREESFLAKKAAAKLNFTGNIHVGIDHLSEDGDSVEHTTTQDKSFSANDIGTFKAEYEKAIEDIERLSGGFETEDGDNKDAYDQSSAKSAAKQLVELERQAATNQPTREYVKGEQMTTTKQAYPLGTMDPKEDKRGTDKMNEEVRMQHKHMFTQDLGPVDGLPKGDLEKKKMVARAAAEERAAKRAALIEKAKLAYPLGTMDPKEDKRGTDKMNEEVRMQHKHMFTRDLGKTDDIPAEDKAIKEKLLRAGLKARFVKAAEPAKSRWEIVSKASDEVLLSATVDELTNGMVDEMHDVVATREYGTKLLTKAAAQGVQVLAARIKTAQPAVPPAAPEAAGAAAPATPPAAPVAAPEAPAAGIDQAVQGAEGEKKDISGLVAELSEVAPKVSELASDIQEAVSDLSGQEAQMGEMEAKASFSTKATLRVGLEALASLQKDAFEVVPALAGVGAELDVYVGALQSSALEGDELASTVAAARECLASAKDEFKRGLAVIEAAQVVAKTNAILRKTAAAEELESDESDADDELAAMDDAEFQALLDQAVPSDSLEDSLDRVEETEVELADDMEADSDMDDAAADMALPVGSKIKTPTGQELEVKASRDLQRQMLKSKLAASTKASPSFEDASGMAHPKGGEDLCELDEKQKTPDALKIETNYEQQEADLKVFTAPAKIKRLAAELRNGIREGKFSVADFPMMIQAGLDPAAVKYFKDNDFLGTDPEAKEFEKELVADHSKQKQAEEMQTFRVKLARAYSLAYEMADVGLVPRAPSAIEEQVNELMEMNDAGFNGMKRSVAARAATQVQKFAGIVPQMGAFQAPVAKAESSFADDFARFSASLGVKNRGF
jgi:hypothetical protein